MLVYILDDSKTDLVRTGSFLKKYAESLGVDEMERIAFDSGDKLISYYKERKEEPYLILLDIYMEGLNGIDTAKALREMGCQSRMIFITSSMEHMMDAFSVYADGYLKKPYSYEDFVSVLDRLKNRFLNEGKSINVVIDRIETSIKINDIVFIEANGHNVILHLNDEEIRINAKISDIQERLEDEPNVIPVGRSFLVNLVHVICIEDGMIVLDNDLDVPIPVRLKKQIEEQFNKYKYEK